MTKPLALLFYEAPLPGSKLVGQLEDLGYEVLTHTQASTLAAQVRESRPFVMIVDLASRNADISGVIRELRQNPETEHIPVLAFSRNAQKELRTSAHQAGATVVAGDAAVLAHLPQLLEQVLEIPPPKP